jgi:hypothetical protein
VTVRSYKLLQWNSVTTNSSGPDIFVRYNRVNLCYKKPIGLKILFVTPECSLTTEFVITEFHCCWKTCIRMIHANLDLVWFEICQCRLCEFELCSSVVRGGAMRHLHPQAELSPTLSAKIWYQGSFSNIILDLHPPMKIPDWSFAPNFVR